jgi:hypothetical protein
MLTFRRSVVLLQHLVSSLRKGLYCTPVEIRMQSALNWRTVQPFTESDGTRCCDNTICPPEDGHVDARNMSKIIM